MRLIQSDIEKSPVPDKTVPMFTCLLFPPSNSKHLSNLPVTFCVAPELPLVPSFVLPVPNGNPFAVVAWLVGFPDDSSNVKRTKQLEDSTEIRLLSK